MERQMQKTIKIKLKPTTEQAKKLDGLISEFIKASSYAVEKIAEIQKSYKNVDKLNGICNICNKEKNLFFEKDDRKYCVSCYKRSYSQYTIQKVDFQKKIGIRDMARLPDSYYANAIRFASDTIAGYDTIKRKKEWSLKSLNGRLAFWQTLLNDPSKRREKKVRTTYYASISDTRENPHYFSINLIGKKIKRLEKKISKFKIPDYPNFDKETISIQKELFKFQDTGFYISGVISKGEKIDFFGKDYVKQYFQDIEKAKKPVILLKKQDGEYFICYPLTKVVALPDWSGKNIEELEKCPDSSFEAAGIDWGIRHIAVMSLLKKHDAIKPEHVKFFNGDYILNKRKHFQSLRKKFGIKKRQDKIEQLGSREMRFVDKYIHNTAREIVDDVKNHSKKPVIVMEDITDNREEADKYLNKKLMNSVRSRLQTFIQYKAEWEGIPFVLINPKYTSQKCNKCGHIDRGNRPNCAKIFKCLKCNYNSNADYNASVNIAKSFYTGGVVAK